MNHPVSPRRGFHDTGKKSSEHGEDRKFKGTLNCQRLEDFLFCISDAKILPVPSHKLLDALLHRGRGLVVKPLNQIGHVGISVWNVPWLHRQKLFGGRPSQSLFYGRNVIKQLYRLVVADVVNAPGSGTAARVWRGATPLRIAGSWPIDDVDDAFDDVVDVGKGTTVPAVVVHLNWLAGEDGLGKLKKRHIRPAPWAIHREKAQASGGQTIEVAVSMSHEFVAFLAGGVQT